MEITVGEWFLCLNIQYPSLEMYGFIQTPLSFGFLNNSAMMVTGSTFIAEMACTNTESCSGVSGNSIIGTSSCTGNNACSNLNGDTTIHSKSCKGNDSCENMSGMTTISSNR